VVSIEVPAAEVLSVAAASPEVLPCFWRPIFSRPWYAFLEVADSETGSESWMNGKESEKWIATLISISERQKEIDFSALLSQTYRWMKHLSSTLWQTLTWTLVAPAIWIATSIERQKATLNVNALDFVVTWISSATLIWNHSLPVSWISNATSVELLSVS
jgi:hypothetical protein